jgi:hypothetical protein
MADTVPAKRRKTSPSTSVPIDVPATPSKIPVPQRDGAKTLPGRPSFASPTKASLSRHNPQLLRPSSSGSGAERPGSRGKNLQDDFAKAQEEVLPSVEAQSVITGEDRQGTSTPSTTQENELPEDHPFMTQRATTPKGRNTRPVGGRLAAKPRRMSRSPVKQTTKAPIESVSKEPAPEVDENVNPFIKRGLRRSPVPGQAETLVQDNGDPFQKKGLRRSPIQRGPTDNSEKDRRVEKTPEIFTTLNEPLPPPVSLQQVKQPVEAQRTLLSQFAEDMQPRSPQRPEPAHSKFSDPTGHEQLQLEPNGDSEPTKKPSNGEFAQVLGDGQQKEDSNAAVEAQKHLLSEAAAVRPTRSPRRPEPELPPTPTQRGIPDPVVTTPPTGIHDTPSKRARKSKALPEKLKSSPLKPRDPPVKELVKEPEPEPEPEALPKPEKPNRRKSTRFLIPEDPYAAKKKARDDLLKELQQLQADVALANQENERLRLRFESKKKATAPANPDALVAMLQRATAPPPSSIPKPTPTSIFKNIEAFLPFTSRRRRPATKPDVETPLPSHLPIALDDPLPYIQAFSPLTYTSTITLLPSNPAPTNSESQEEEQPILQKHIINASHPSGLFSTRFAMTVDTSALSITSIDILRLDMSAERELGTFIRERARGEGALGKDITVICWAMGRWIEVAIQRASFWCAVETEFGTPEARSKSLQRKKKRKAPDDEEEGSQEVQKKKWTRKQLLPHIGRSSMELVSDEVELRCEWKIRFDWTGEVDSAIAANARLPRHCTFLLFPSL